MIDKTALEQFLLTRLYGAGYFLVDLRVSQDNVIVVEIEAEESGANIDFCVELSRDIQAKFDRDVEDYELEVGSAGLTSPFKVRGQYIKNIGNEVEVLATDGKKHRGILTEVTEDGFCIETEQKVRHEGAKRPVIEKVPLSFKFSEAKQTKYIF